MEPDSNQQSSTSGTRRIVDCPVGSSGLGRVRSSTAGRCRSVISVPKSRWSSSIEPYTSTLGYVGSSLFHTGIGEPQNRFRLIAQSRAFSIHLPKLPSLTCSGTQVISWFSSTIRSRNSVTLTNHDEIAAVHERLRAAPAVRIRVVVAVMAHDRTLVLQTVG